MASKADRKDLPDIQNTPDTRGKKIERVGISNVSIPLRLQRKNFDDKLPATVTTDVSMYVSISSEARGINMSRLMQTLMVYESQMISSKFIEHIIKDMLKANENESDDGYLKIGFKYFVERLAPVSQLRGVHGYDCAFIGRFANGVYDFAIEVNVVGTNLCPCSREISIHGAHNQRNHVRVRLSPTKDFYWIEDIIDLVEKELSCPIYPLLKREDEKWVTETAYENPKFVEDIARDVSIELDKKEVNRYHVRSSADESIHHHQAEAFISKNWNLG